MTELYEALSNIQNLGLTAKKDSTAGAGSFSYKYADLEQIWNTIRTPLEENGLIVVQTPEDGSLKTTVVHVKTGQLLDSHTALLTADTSKNHMQDLGAAITYARRYALACMFNIVTNDDDAASTTQEAPAARKAVQSSPASEKQIAYARKLLTERNYSPEAIDRRLEQISGAEVSTLIAGLLGSK